MFIVEADYRVDGVGDLSRTHRVREALKKTASKVREFEIASIKDGWQTPLPENRLRCACSPMIAILEAQRLFSRQEADAVVIRGRDFIRSEFRDRKAERKRLMHLYGEDGHILDAYNRLAHAFLSHWRIAPEEFRDLAGALFENHFRVWRRRHPNAERPEGKWFEPVTDLFRGVDCANPSVDFEGCLIIATGEAAKRCGIAPESCVRIAGCRVEQACEDTLESIPRVVPYRHLRAAFEKTCDQAQVDFREAFLSGKALLEVYTCYPVVPLGFLLATGFAGSIREIREFVAGCPLTITGGLNLAKAPWNNTTLYAIAEMANRLKMGDAPCLGGIHSVGALGYKQAFAILQKVPPV
jgi:hypothetical protein